MGSDLKTPEGVYVVDGNMLAGNLDYEIYGGVTTPLNLPPISWTESRAIPARAFESIDEARPAPHPREVQPQCKLSQASLKLLFERANIGLVTVVDSFQAQISGNDMTVNFELTNVHFTSALSGATELTLICNDDKVLDVEANKVDLSLHIQSFKYFHTSFNMPNRLERRYFLACA